MDYCLDRGLSGHMTNAGLRHCVVSNTKLLRLFDQAGVEPQGHSPCQDERSAAAADTFSSSLGMSDGRASYRVTQPANCTVIVLCCEPPWTACQRRRTGGQIV